MLCLRVFIIAAALVVGCSLHAVAADGPPDKSELIAEYSKAMDFAAGQVLDASISDHAVMKVTIDECSFCGALKNEDSRNRIARSTLQWFLSQTGNTTATVEWYNRSQVKIMAISGNRDKSEVTSGMPCAIPTQHK